MRSGQLAGLSVDMTIKVNFNNNFKKDSGKSIFKYSIFTIPYMETNEEKYVKISNSCKFAM